MSQVYHLVARCCDPRTCTVADLERLYKTLRPIQYHTFARRLGPDNLAQLNQELGYNESVTLDKDYCVSFHSGVFRGQPCVHLDWSRIDHIFIPQS